MVEKKLCKDKLIILIYKTEVKCNREKLNDLIIYKNCYGDYFNGNDYIINCANFNELIECYARIVKTW